MKTENNKYARMGRKIIIWLLAGAILAACSACGSQPPVQSLPVKTDETLPTIWTPERDLFPSSRAPETGSTAETEAESTKAPETESEAVTSSENVPQTEAPTQTVTPPETKTPETTPSETSAPRPQAEIHAIPQSEIDEIRSHYDGTVNGFGTGFRHNWVDENNRPTMVNNLLARFAGTDAKLLGYCSDVNEKCVAFSFQCGTEYGHTGAVLDILKKYGVKATFYIIHSYGEHNHALVERMIREGHDIGSHTYSCPNGGIANWTLEAQMEDALKMQQYVQDSFGYTMSKYNFNSGYWSEQAIIMMSRMGYQVDFCSCNYSDYDPNATFDQAALITDLENCLHPGCIYCFHTTNVITPTILDPLIKYCIDQGYRIVAVP